MQVSKEFQQQEQVRISSSHFHLSNSSPKVSTVVGFLMLVFCQTCRLLAFAFKEVKKVVVFVMFHMCKYLLSLFAFG